MSLSKQSFSCPKNRRCDKLAFSFVESRKVFKIYEEEIMRFGPQARIKLINLKIQFLVISYVLESLEQQAKQTLQVEKENIKSCKNLLIIFKFFISITTQLTCILNFRRVNLNFFFKSCQFLEFKIKFIVIKKFFF